MTPLRILHLPTVQRPHAMARTWYYVGAVATLAAAYYVTGRLGLLLAVPPGYATIIWPPSGVSIAALLLYGWRLWPGILVGSFILNCYISSAFSPADGFVTAKVVAAFGIAAGSTLQALAARVLVKRCVGLPLKLAHVTQVVRLLFLSSPLSCLIAATIGIGTLFLLGLMPPEQTVGNWFTWWVGDAFGVIVFLPLALVAPGTPNRITWRGDPLGSLPVIAMVTLCVPLGLTLYSWKIMSEMAYRDGQSNFQTLALEYEKALQHQLGSYNHALLGAEGLLQQGTFVSRQQWRGYVEALDVQTNFPGMLGLGWIAQVQSDRIPEFLMQQRNDGALDFTIHPQAADRPYYIVTYIEPVHLNQSAPGLNIAFEDRRLEAAALARDSGQSTITKFITLVQDDAKTVGFLLLHPVYDRHAPIKTAQERQAALLGWIYAPFTARNFLQSLPLSQSNSLKVSIYDGDIESPDTLIYTSNEARSSNISGAFTVRKQLNVAQQKWQVVWNSTTAYEQSVQNSSALFILVGGVLFTGLFGAVLLMMSRMERNRAAARSARLKDEFIATVSHELRTPLTSIAVSLELLADQEDANRSAPANELLAIARTNSERLARLVNDILDIEKLEAGKVSFDMQRVNIVSFVQRALDINLPMAASCGVTLRFENASRNDVYADPDRLMQVATNLLSNACKFSPAGAEVVVKAEDRGDKIRISVRDHGSGIPGRFRHRIFEKFAQADNSDKRQKVGTGLGLSIVKEIVERLGGEVSFTDAPGGGTIFFFDLPALGRASDNDALSTISQSYGSISRPRESEAA